MNSRLLAFMRISFEKVSVVRSSARSCWSRTLLSLAKAIAT